MARRARVSVGGMVYHVLNRGNCRMRIFGKEGDYVAFLKLMEEARRETGMRILGYCMMPNHWHLVLWPREDGDLARFVGWVSSTHVRRWRAHRRTEGEGHLYQGRYKSFIVKTDSYLLTVLRYVEQNPLRAGLVERSKDWKWSSAGVEAKPVVDQWPIPRPGDWEERLDTKLPQKVLERLGLCVARGQPFGDEAWTAKLSVKLGLEHTLRDPWRPTRKPALEEGEK